MATLSVQHATVCTGEKEMVHDISFSLEKGTVTVLMGPNGSGKSTLVNALMGHPSYTLTKGSLFFEGEDITTLSVDKKAKKGFFLSLQHIPKIGGITLAAFLHKIHTSTTCANISVLDYYLQLRDMASEFDITDELLNRELTDGLSGGEKKLSEVLQLAALEPKVAILDEIDSGVDVDAMRKVFRVISKLKEKGTAFLVISHNTSLLDHLAPEQVLVMNSGTLVRTGGKELAEKVLVDGFTMD